MKTLLLLTLFYSMIFADFFVVNGNQKVKMSPLKTGKIDFSTFKTIAFIERGNEELHALAQEPEFNHRHLNFRISTIGLTQSNYYLTEWSKPSKEKAQSYEVNFDDYTREDGVMLQLFYKNRWYAAILGKPLEILHDMFLKLDMESVDLEKAITAIKQARVAYPLDDKLKMVEIELEHRFADEKVEKHKQIKVDFKML